MVYGYHSKSLLTTDRNVITLLLPLAARKPKLGFPYRSEALTIYRAQLLLPALPQATTINVYHLIRRFHRNTHSMLVVPVAPQGRPPAESYVPCGPRGLCFRPQGPKNMSIENRHIKIH